MKPMIVTLLAGSTLALAACASDKPVGALSQAESAVANAQAADAGRLAPSRLTAAQQKLAEARRLAKEGEPDDARLRAEEARAEANAARAAATEIRAQDTAEALAAAETANSTLAATNSELTSRLAELEAEETERGTVVTLGDVLFRTDRAELTPEGRLRVARIAETLRADPGTAVVIEGHADARGEAAYNQRLSEARAEAVTRALLGEGIATPRVVYTGLGESSPIATNATAEGRQLNRRVDVIFVDQG